MAYQPPNAQTATPFHSPNDQSTPPSHQPLIQNLRPPLNPPTKQRRTQTSKQNQSPTKSIKRFLRSREEIQTKPMTCLRNTMCNSNECRLFAPGRRYHIGFPEQLEIETVVGAAHEKDDTDVARCDVHCGDQNCTPCCGEDDGDYDVVAGFLASAGGVGEETGYDVDDGVGWCLYEIGGKFIKAKNLQNLSSLSEVRILRRLAACWGRLTDGKTSLKLLSIDERKVHATKQPSEGILSSIFDAIPSASHAFIFASTGYQNSVLCHFTFLF
jgi:hypothetical protein